MSARADLRVLGPTDSGFVPAWERNMNPEQLAVIRHEAGPLENPAQAGSGKTRALVHRIARLVFACGVEASRIFAVTFSKKAADEMDERVTALGVRGCAVQTWHAFCYRVLREDATKYASWEIDEKNRAKFLLKDAIGYKHLDWKGCDFSRLTRFITCCKARLAVPDSPEGEAACKEIASKPDFFPRGRDAAMAVAAYRLQQQMVEASGVLTFDDMLVYVYRHFQDEQNRARWASKFDHVLQDEYQDANLAQKEIARQLAQDHRNYMVVGDPAQCHPAGVQVEIEAGHTVSIESLCDGDEVRSWNQNAQKMIGGRRVRVGKRRFIGRLIDVIAAGRTVPVTPNHRFIARWTDRTSDVCVTYLMKRSGFGYRVGWCKLFACGGEGSNGFHLAQRARIEKADSVWILRVHRSRTDASVYESIVAAKYGLPTATFEPVNGAQHQTAEAIDAIFTALRSGNAERAEICLRDHGREPTLPLYPWPSQDGPEAPQGRRTIFQVHASNVLEDVMSVPLPDSYGAWTRVESAKRREELFDGDVYSLDVAEDHSYAANGVVVLNSIYGFRGSSPEHIMRFGEEWPGGARIAMCRNYRCGKRIVAFANEVIRPAETRLPEDMIAECQHDGEVEVLAAQTLDDEAEEFASMCEREANEHGHERYREIACLFRTNAQSRALEEALLRRRIPYVILGGTCFYERKEVKDLLAYLRVAIGRDTPQGDSVKRCINAPFRYLGARFVDRVKATMADEPNPVAAVMRAAEQDGVQARQRASAADWARIVDEVRREATVEIEREDPESGEIKKKRVATAGELVNLIVTRTNYIGWLEKEEGEESIESSHAANVRELIRVAAAFPTAGEFLDYVERCVAEQAKQRRQRGGGSRVLLMSIHRSKGLEWPIVWVVGCNDGIFPHARGDVEEERRLMYVAVTRAKDRLVCSHVRELATRAGLKQGQPSPFLLPHAELAERWRAEDAAKPAAPGQVELFGEPDQDPNDGAEIEELQELEGFEG